MELGLGDEGAATRHTYQRGMRYAFYSLRGEPLQLHLTAGTIAVTLRAAGLTPRSARPPFTDLVMPSPKPVTHRIHSPSSPLEVYTFGQVASLRI